MPASPLARTAGRVAGHMPGLRRLPVMRLLLLGEVILLARSHIERLTPRERRRLVILMREARGRPSHLDEQRRAEFQALVAKADPKLFATAAAAKLSPVPLPRRFIERPAGERLTPRS